MASGRAILHGNVEFSILVLSTEKRYSSFLKRVCFFSRKFISELTQLAHDVVTMLDFGCILISKSDNVVTTLSQRCVSDVVTTTKNERCYNVVFSTSVFWPGIIDLTGMSWFWCRFPDENLKVFQHHYNYLFSKIYNIAFQIHFLINKINSVYVNAKSSNGGYLKIYSSLPEQRKGIFDLV